VTSTLGRLVAIAQVPRWRAALSVLLGALAVCFGVALMATAGYLISRAAEQPPILSLTVTIVAVRFFGLARPLARYLDRLVGHDLALGALGRIRSRFYERIEPLAPAQLESYRRGDLLERMVGDIDALQGLYLRGLGPPLVALAVGACCVGAAAAFLPLAAAILAAGLVVSGFAVPALSGALARAAARRQRVARGELTAELVELLRGAPELVVYGQEEETSARIRRLDDELARLGRRDALVAGLGDALTILVAGLTVAGVLAVAVSAHDVGTLDRVLVATLALLALSSFDAVLPLPAAARELSISLAAGRRVLELTDAEPIVRDPVSPLAAPPRSAAVALERVTARYADDETPALRDLDLRLEPGRRIALVGPSGAGKTTVTNLLFRFLDPEQGRVTIAGRDLREYRQEDVRGTFALAGQEAHLFASSIRENLRLSRPTAGDEDLMEALQRAQIADWVASLPDGLDTFVGEEGDGLSGGQRQRLVLARALLADAPVLVLDEPTAHLDTATAQSLMDDVLTAAGDRTVLLITHRPEGLEHMDEVVTLDAGERASKLRRGSPRADDAVRLATL
jgi:ATP-binding cassette subfamily C protein CydC